MSEPTRTFAAGADGLLHGVLTLEGDAQTYCATPLATEVHGTDGGVPIHTQCWAIETLRLAGQALPH